MTLQPAIVTWRRFVVLSHAEVLHFLREGTILVRVLGFPVALMLVYGVLFGRRTVDVGGETLPFIYLLTPQMMVLTLMVDGVVANATIIAVYRANGFLERIRVGPAPLWQYFVSRMVTHAGVMLVQALVLIVTSAVVFGARYRIADLLVAVPAIVLTAVMFMAMGLAVAAFVVEEQNVNTVALLVHLSLFIGSGIMLPFADFPPWLEGLRTWLPSTIACRLIQAPLLGLGTSGVAADAAAAAAFFLAALGLASRFFRTA
jgi:ABC-2 type transport system permease protein